GLAEVRPATDRAELAVNAVVTGFRVGRDGPAEYLLHEHPAEDRLAPDVEVGRRRRRRGDAARVGEVRLVVAAAASHGQRHRQPRATPAGPPDALLVVEPLWRHVA